MSELDRFAAILETKKEMFEKKWSQDVDTKWSPPDGLFTKPAKDIAAYLAEKSPDYATAIRRAVFYYNRGGYCNKGGEHFDKKECAKACQVLKALAKAFKIEDKDRSKNELEFCKVSEASEPSVKSDLLTLAEAILEKAPYVAYDNSVSPETIEADFTSDMSDYTKIVEEWKSANPDHQIDVIGVSATPFGVEVDISFQGAENYEGYLVFPEDFSFPSEIGDTTGLSLKVKLTKIIYFDSMQGRSLDEKKVALGSVLSSVQVERWLSGEDDAAISGE